MTKKVGALFYSLFMFIHQSTLAVLVLERNLKSFRLAGYEVGSLLHRERLEELYRSHPSFVSNGGHDNEL